MPYASYIASGIGPLRDTRVVVQLADRSTACLAGVVEDVLVIVNGYLFPADFYVLEQDDDMRSYFENPSPHLLGRPFLKMAKTKIDVNTRTLTMKFAQELITFNLYDSARYPEDFVGYIGMINDNERVLEECIVEVFREEFEDKGDLEVVLVRVSVGRKRL